MKSIIFLGFCLTAVLAVPAEVFDASTRCTDDLCKIENNCRCSSPVGPFADRNKIPQLISLTFDEAVTEDLYTQYWSQLLLELVNPDNEPIGATFFVPHEYTDYARVNDLYNYGFEIGVHSVTKNNLQSYWRSASEDVLLQEFGGQKQILQKYANIPADDIRGVRTPQLQLHGNISINAYVKSGLKYDSSWPTLSKSPLYPYTLDYLSSQACLVGGECPNEAFPGFWILPIIDLTGEKGEDCNTIASCNVTGTGQEIGDWLIGEVQKVRSGTKAPLTLLVRSYWFDFTENSLAGFKIFLKKMSEFKDVFFVSQRQVLEWMQKPVPLSEFKTNNPITPVGCKPVNCKMEKPNGDTRYMNSCVPCPVQYPWLGNPNGNAQ